MMCWGKRGSEPVFPLSLQARSVLPHDLARLRGLMEPGATGLRHGALIRPGATARWPRIGAVELIGVPAGARSCPGKTRTHTQRGTTILSAPPDDLPA
jgi:hypothetical protein